MEWAELVIDNYSWLIDQSFLATSKELSAQKSTAEYIVVANILEKGEELLVLLLIL